MNENTKEEKALSPINVIELDYDKLAAAIVQAQEKAKELKLGEKKEASAEIKAEEKKGRIRRFFHKINTKWEIWKANINQKMQEIDAISKAFSVLIFLVLAILGSVGLIFSIPVISAFKEEIIAPFNQNVIGNIMFVVYNTVALTYSVILIIASLEILASKDKQYIVAVFSALTSLAAVIVALVALFK